MHVLSPAPKAFTPANALVSGQLPSVVLGGPSLLDRPRRVASVGGKLWVGNRFDADIGNDDFGLFGFSLPLSTGQAPSVRLTTPIEEPHDLLEAGGAIFGNSMRFNFAFVFKSPGSLTTGNNSPSLSFFDPRVDQPIGMAAKAR